MRTVYGVVVMVFLVVWCEGEVADQSCGLQPDLYRQRISVASERDSAITKGDTIQQDQAKAKINIIDQQYYGLMRSLSETAANEKIPCCTQAHNGDIVVHLLCTLASYHKKRITPQTFVQEFPDSFTSRKALWTLDEIADLDQADTNVKRVFGHSGPVSSYITELFSLVKENNKAAMKKYMDLYVVADGVYAELMDDQVEQLFLKKPRLVLQNWTTIKTNPRTLKTLRETLSAVQKRQIIAQTKRYCSVDETACDELRTALK